MMKATLPADFQLSAETQFAVQCAYNAETPDELRAAAKEAVAGAARDCVRALLLPVADLAVWILFAEALARATKAPQ